MQCILQMSKFWFGSKLLGTCFKHLNSPKVKFYQSGTYKPRGLKLFVAKNFFFISYDNRHEESFRCFTGGERKVQRVHYWDLVYLSLMIASSPIAAVTEAVSSWPSGRFSSICLAVARSSSQMSVCFKSILSSPASSISV